jgi:cell division septal protein FtsQ
MTLRAGGVRRRSGHARRGGRIRRASAGLSPVRGGAGLAIVVCIGAIYGVTASPVFGMDVVRVEGARFTDHLEVEEQLAVASGANLFTLATEPLEARLTQLPTVARAEVTVALPSTVVVTVIERAPLLVWRVEERRYLADIEGRLIAELADRPDLGPSDLPVVTDRRLAASAYVVGRGLDPADLDAARRLASLTPDQLGSNARLLRVSVTDEHGFVLEAPDVGWTAIFGFYTPSLRTTELIPEQVRLLRSLLAGREDTIDRVVLASATEGTYTLKPGARRSQSPAP